MLRTGQRSMRAVRTGLVWLAALAAGACSLSLDGDHFLEDPDAGPGDARAPDRPDADPPEDDPDPDGAATCGETCETGDNCDLHCPDRACPCRLDCDATGGTCKPKCEHHDCAIDCRRVDTCEATCKDSDCTIDCTGARDCDRVKCEDGSGCLLDCSGTGSCAFEECDGEVISCPGSRLACDRACP